MHTLMLFYDLTRMVPRIWSSPVVRLGSASRVTFFPKSYGTTSNIEPHFIVDEVCVRNIANQC